MSPEWLVIPYRGGCRVKKLWYNSNTRKREKEMATSPILREFRRGIINWFEGVAIPHQPSVADGVYTPIRSEKVMKFNRKALRQIGKRKVEKVDPRYKGGDDLMIVKVGKPGSRERVEALAAQYAAIQNAGEEISPFAEG